MKCRAGGKSSQSKVHGRNQADLEKVAETRLQNISSDQGPFLSMVRLTEQCPF